MKFSMVLAAGVALLLVPKTSRAEPEEVARFLTPEAWDMTIEWKCEGKQSGAVPGGQSTDTLKESGTGKVHLTTTVAIGPKRRLNGPFVGTHEIYSQGVTDYAHKQIITTTTTSSGDGGGPKIRGRLELDSGDGTYMLGIDMMNIKTNITIRVDPPGYVSASKGNLVSDFVSERIKLPEHGMEISGTKELDKGPCFGEMPLRTSFKRTVTWKITPVMDKLEAIPRVGVFHRGEKAHLDGSASTGKPVRYAWTITPRQCPKVRTGSCDQVPDKADPTPKPKEGETWDVTLLCDADVKLEVWNASGEHAEKTIEAKVTPRGWTIPFARNADHNLHQTLGSLGWALGMNECDVAGEAGRHWIHAKTVGATGNNWRPFVKYQTVSDGDSPFNGWGYVSELDKNLAVSRIEHVNAELFPGASGMCGGQTLRDYNAAHRHGAQVDMLAASVQDHERAHSELAQKSLASANPAADLEALVQKAPAKIPDLAQATLEYHDNMLYEAASEANVKKELAKKYGKKKVEVLVCSPTDKKSFVLSEAGDNITDGDTPHVCNP